MLPYIRKGVALPTTTKIQTRHHIRLNFFYHAERREGNKIFFCTWQNDRGVGRQQSAPIVGRSFSSAPEVRDGRGAVRTPKWPVRP